MSTDVSIDQLVARASALAERGQRTLLGITGTPGAGKSTTSAALLDALGDKAQLVPMDGFHLANEELVRLGRRDRKGAPDTFDVDGFLALLTRLRTQTVPTIYAPFFNRGLEESIGSALPISADTPLLIVEGNYLLTEGHGWDAVAALLDECWYLDVNAAERERRLVARRTSTGEAEAKATAWVTNVDEPNALLVEQCRGRADHVFTVAQLG